MSNQHPDDAAVDRFAATMKAKLAKKRADGYGNWDDPAKCDTHFLADLLLEHIPKGDPVDIANFCMMLHERGAPPLEITRAYQEQVTIDAVNRIHRAEPAEGVAGADTER